MRIEFQSAEELLDLLKKFRWDSDLEIFAHKMQLTHEPSTGKWRWVVFDEGNQTKWLSSPQTIVIYLDRHKNVRGFMVLHGALDSYKICGEGKV